MGISKIGQTFTIREILDLVRDDLDKVEREIALESMAAVESISRVGKYLQENGGKRLRPILLLLTARLTGTVSDSTIRLATIVEMIHTATLVHDDVIDEASSRRGKPSANVIWGNQVSVLAGDWLYMQAFAAALRERNFRIFDILLALTQMLVEGELLQLERIGRINISESDYFELIDRKTASLFSTCAKLGALTTGADEETEHRAGEFAWNLGMAFQIMDDILDFTAEESMLGKPVGNDLREGKVTLPLIYALEHADENDQHAVATVLRDGNYEHLSMEEIRVILERTGGLERARAQAEKFAQRARQIIMSFPDSPYQRALLTVTGLVTERSQ